MKGDVHYSVVMLYLGLCSVLFVRVIAVGLVTIENKNRFETE